MCFSANSSIYGVGGCFLFAEISAAAIHFGIAAAFLFVFLPEAVAPLQLPAERRRIAHWPLQSEKPDVGADRPSASGVLLNVVFLFCMVRTTKQNIKIKDSFLEEM